MYDALFSEQNMMKATLQQEGYLAAASDVPCQGGSRVVVIAVRCF